MANKLAHLMLMVDSETIPDAPSSVTITQVIGTSFDVAWTDNSDNETSFQVQYQIDGGSWVDTSDSPLAANSTSDSQTIVGVTDYVRARVRATNAVGSSAYSTSPFTYTQPEGPTGATLVNSIGDSMELSWTDNSSNEDGFRIEGRKNGGSWEFLVDAAANDTTESIDVSTAPLSASNGDDIEMRVRAERTEGVFSGYSTSSAVVMA